MQLSTRGRQFIKGLEGLRLEAYWDVDGWSIGYGHHSGVEEGDVITKGEAEQLFLEDVAKYEASVNRAALPASQQQFDAMVALAWNVGVAGFESSTVARLHRAGDTAGAANAFRMWTLSGGDVDPVLVARRERERNLYLNGDTSLPPGFSFELGQGPSPLVMAVAAALLAYVALPRVRLARRVLALT